MTRNVEIDPAHIELVLDAAVKTLDTAQQSLTLGDLRKRARGCLRGKLPERHVNTKAAFTRLFRATIEDERWPQRVCEIKRKRERLRYGLESFPEVIAVRAEEVGDVQCPDPLRHDKFTSLLRKQLHGVHWRSLERLLKHIVEKRGYEAELTPRSGDGGFDVMGFKSDELLEGKQEYLLVDAKKYKNNVGPEQVKAFQGTLTQFKATNPDCSKLVGVLASTSGFTSDAKEFVRDTTSRGNENLELWDGERLVTEMISCGLGVRYTIDIDFFRGLG